MARGPVLYCLSVAPGESEGEGEDTDEWFRSLKEAKKRRRQLIAEDPDLDGHRYGEDFQITRVEFASLPRVELLLRALNRDSLFFNRRIEVPAYVPPRRREAFDGCD